MIIQQAALAQGLIGKEKTAQFREGEIFPAKVVKMLPNGMAELSTGTTTMVAKLEVPLQSGERYWFRVTSTNEGVQLQVITSPTAASESIARMAKDLLLQLSLPLTKENKSFVEMMMKAKIPLTKELIIKAGEWLAKAPLTEGLQVIKMMAKLSLPMTKDVFQPLMTAHSPAPLSQLTEELAAKLQQMERPPASAAALTKLLQEWQTPLEKHTTQKIMAKVMERLFLPEKVSASKEAALDLVKSWGIIPETAETIEDALVQIMRQWKGREGVQAEAANQLPSSPKEVPLKEALSPLIQQPMSKEALQKLEQALSTHARAAGKTAIEPLLAEIKTLVDGLKGKDFNNEQLAAIFKTAAKVSVQHGQPKEALRQLAALFNKEAEELIRVVKNETAILHASPLASLSKKEILFQQIVLALENDRPFPLTAKEAHSIIKDTFQLLGVDLEGKLGSNKSVEAELEKMIKPQLLRLLSENIPVHVREPAEQLLGRMNVQPLLSTENGPLQQLIMQVPMNLFGFHTEMTLQWSGKKTEDGKLDSNFCRVLFYLELEHIKETVIDMQVQNRVIQLQVFNGTPGLKAAAAALIPALKTGIEEKGYQLSSVQFKQSQKNKQPALVRAMEAPSYEGVDIRI
ncbi:hypothetical protein A8F95_12780 [Bacillus wudalianchiensis]|uniref:Flagellar hook-length control protein-like C-terminal domain-containing protein n=1 Tax=Pseudobacillus wudalianchiensis TaxID=1743143 RepID=A0A1B9AJ31_9BACI|nr:hypothetical protein A8F95_12780 [Bacillus wudalianchiensis]